MVGSLAMRLKTALLLSALLLVVPMAATAAEPEVLRVGVRPYAPPFQYLAKVNGELAYSGSWAEYFKHFEAELGVRFKYVHSPELGELREWLEAGRIDMYTGGMPPVVADDNLRIPVAEKIFNAVYAHESCPAETCLDDIGHKRVAVISDTRYDEGLTHLLPPAGEPLGPARIFAVRTPLEALKLLGVGLGGVVVGRSLRIGG